MRERSAPHSSGSPPRSYVLIVGSSAFGPPDSFRDMLTGSFVTVNALLLAAGFLLLAPFAVFFLFNLFLIYFKVMEADDDFLDVWLKRDGGAGRQIG